MLKIATNDLIKELDRGTELHLSLNLPDYVEELQGDIKIDYEKIRKLKKAEEEPEQLSASQEAPKDPENPEETT